MSHSATVHRAFKADLFDFPARRASAARLALLTALALSGPVFAQSDDDASTDSVEEDDDLGQGEVIVITGSRVEQPLAATTTATEVITRQEIEDSGANSVAELLQEHPGIQLVDGLQGSSIEIQGLDPSYVLVLVDGKRVIGRVFGAIDLERYNIENVERIEIVKGASSALYGSDAIAGVVNIITRKATRPVQGEVTVQYGNLGLIDTTGLVALQQGDWNTRLSGGYHAGDGWDLEPESVHTTGSKFLNWQIANQTTFDRGPLQLTATLDYLRRDLRRIDSSIAGSDDIGDDANNQAMATLDRRSVIEIATAALRAKYKLSDTKRISAGFDYSYYRDQLAYDQRGSNDLDVYEEALESLAQMTAQFDGTFAKRHMVTAGVDGMREFLDSPRLRERTGDFMCDVFVPDPDNPDAEPPPNTCDTTGDRYRGAVFAQDEYLLLRDPQLILVPGIRLDLDSQFGAHLSPKLGLRWDPTPEVTVRAAYGHGYRAPDFKELYLCFENINAGYFVVGNPDLQPERSHNINFGVEQRPNKRLWISFNVFYNTLDNLISFELAPNSDIESLPTCSMNLLAPYTHRNIASAFTRGGEVLVRARPKFGPIDGITLEAGYTLTDSRDRELQVALPGRAQHRGTLKFGYEHTGVGFRTNVRGNIVGSRPFYDGFDDNDQLIRVHADGYTSIDIRAEQIIMTRFILYAGVKNLFDEGDVTFLPIAPRTFYLGMRAKY